MEKDFSRNADNGYFHVCTDGEALPWLFKDEADFIQGTNRIGICIHSTKVELISHVLMDNHIHFVLYGTMPQCKEFVNRYKHLTGKYICKKYAIEGYLRGVPTKIIPIKDEEYLLSVIAYIDRNTIVAGYRYLPSEYHWGTARYLFCRKEHPQMNTITIGNIPVTEQRQILETRTRLPSHWRIFSNGMLDLQSFWNAETVEKLFKSPIRYLYFLSRKLEGEIDSTIAHSNKSFIPDKELRITVSLLAQEIHGCTEISKLDISARLALARKLRYEFASTPKQIARMLHLNPEILKGYI